MSPAIVDRVARSRKAGIGECPDGHPNTTKLTLFRMEDGCSAHWAEAESKLGTLITGADVLCGRAEDPVWRRKARQRGKDATRSLLTSKAMADADNTRLTFNLDTK